jgi:hypothetical protein
LSMETLSSWEECYWAVTVTDNKPKWVEGGLARGGF